MRQRSVQCCASGLQQSLDDNSKLAHLAVLEEAAEHGTVLSDIELLHLLEKVVLSYTAM